MTQDNPGVSVVSTQASEEQWRIAIWNACQHRGMSQDGSIAVVATAAAEAARLAHQAPPSSSAQPTDTVGEVERLRAVLAEIAAPIEGQPVGDPWAFYADVQNLAAEALAHTPPPVATATVVDAEEVLTWLTTQRSMPTMDAPWSTAWNACVDHVERHIRALATPTPQAGDQ